MASICATSPRGAGAGWKASGNVSVSSAANIPSGANVHQELPAFVVEISRDSKDRYELAERSKPSAATGPLAPMAAASQPAARNSASVASRSAMRVRIFSGSSSTTCVPWGISAGSGVRGASISAGISASMPSAGVPSASLVSSSTSVGLPGCCTANCCARRETSSVTSSSRQGYTSTRATSISGMVRWSATENWRISVTSSPQNSMRTG